MYLRLIIVMNNLKELDKIIDNPKNYAAIYARISGTKDNNSISSQIQLATNALKEKNLLIYNTYIDFDSAKADMGYNYEKILWEIYIGIHYFFYSIYSYSGIN